MNFGKYILMRIVFKACGPDYCKSFLDMPK